MGKEEALWIDPVCPKSFHNCSVTNGANANETNDSGSTFNATGEHSGDIINTSSSSHVDSDPDASPTLRISAIQPSGGSSSSVTNNTS